MIDAPAPDFMHRFLAFRQYIEYFREKETTKTTKSSLWKLIVRRGALVEDFVRAFSTNFSKQRLLIRTFVTFVDASDRQEPGRDDGGLSSELYSCFFREILRPEALLFEGASDSSIGLLPAPDAPVDAMLAVGRALCKCVLDDQPLGRGIGRFVFEYLADAHERRVFKDAASALAVLADLDPEMARSWATLLVTPVEGLTLDAFDPDLGDEAVPCERAAFERAVLAGCRHRLLGCRERSLKAILSGFTDHGMSNPPALPHPAAGPDALRWLVQASTSESS